MSIGGAGTNLSRAEWRAIQLLVVEPDQTICGQLQHALRELGPGAVYDVPDHKEALVVLTNKPITHLIFSTTATSLDAVDFLSAAMLAIPDLVALPCSAEPDADQVFDLLMLGARAYLVVPVSVDSMEKVVSIATRTESIPDATLEGNDKNRAMATMLVNCLDEIADVMRKAKDNGVDPKGLPELMSKFRDAAEATRAFSRGSEMQLLDTLQEFCIEKAKQGSTTRLGDIRKRLSSIREKERHEESED